MLKIYLPIALSICVVSTSASAHGPIFSPGPETVFKGGYEFHADIHREKSGNEQEDEIGTEVAYGITADWLVGIGTHYSFLKEEGERNDGFGNLELSTKYRFWRCSAILHWIPLVIIQIRHRVRGQPTCSSGWLMATKA